MKKKLKIKELHEYTDKDLKEAVIFATDEILEWTKFLSGIQKEVHRRKYG